LLDENGGKCGVCGDPFTSTKKENENGGIYDQGIITRLLISIGFCWIAKNFCKMLFYSFLEIVYSFLYVIQSL